MADPAPIVRWLQDRLAGAEADGFIVGLSGGIDSAVVARLCQMAAPGAVLAAIMPCGSDPADERDARLVADAYSLPVARIDLEAVFERLVGDLDRALAESGRRPPRAEGSTGVAAPCANLKPRLRMVTLYYLANSLNALVAGTGNRSEIAVGYYTKYGDGGVDLLPIGHLLKSEVVALARALAVPESVVVKAPSAGLWAGQTDEGEMGFTYADLERYLTAGRQAVAADVAARIDRLIRASGHKRALPPMPG